ncbi:MAG: RDD family protein [Xanthomonadaceae bacterium]|nr:RDD family protein [Xanthomonadaceae bacterium]
MEPIPAGGAQALPDHLHAPLLHAGFWRRFAAYVIDMLILGAAVFVLYMLFVFVVIVPAAASGGRHVNDAAIGASMLMAWLAVIVAQWLYFALCESSAWQATPGKMALNMCVTDTYGRRIGFGQATGRYFGKILSSFIFDIGFMMAGWTARKQALHDLMANCCVVRKEGLAAFERGDLDRGAAQAGAAMPGWAIALIAVGALFFTVVPVVAILAAIAIPAYQTYLVRAQVAEGMTLSGGAKVAVGEYLGARGSLPADNTAAGLADPDTLNGQYVSSVQVQNGSVIVTFGGRANQAVAGDHLVFSPYGSRGAVQWRCGSPDIQAKYLPLACRDRSDAIPVD